MNEIAQVWWIELIKVSPGLITASLAVYLVYQYQNELRALFQRIDKFKGFGIEAEFASKSLDKAISAQQVVVCEEDRQSALRRLNLIAQLLNEIRVLWIDDNHASTRYERELLEKFGVRFTLASTSARAEAALQENIFLFVITDINREGRNTEGLDFVNRIADNGIYRWTIAYVGTDQQGLPRPPNLFGITNRPDHLIHLVCDIVEREKL